MVTSAQDQFYRRAIALATILLSVVVIVVLRLVYWQIEQAGGTINDPAPETILPAVRGNIYDRNGYLLALATTVYDIGAWPHNIRDPAMVADRLAPLLGEPREKLEQLLRKDSAYVFLKRGVSEAVKDSLMEWGEGMFQVDPRPSRTYPHGTLAACVLGFVTDNREAHYGLEQFYNGQLDGKAGFRVADRDPLGSLMYQFRAPRNGADLYLTLDRNIQYVVEDALAKAVVATEAKRGIAIVMDPASGAILGMASYPTYDPNTRDVEDKTVFVNPAISDQYEPGSVFKIVTIASALDAGTITPASTYYDGGEIVVGGRVIKNSDRQAHGQTTMSDLLANSLNVGAAHVSTTLGAIKFYEYVRRFGFGQYTGVDLADEITGQLRVPGDKEWHESDLGTNSFGQGLAATPLQMLCAVSAVANHGVYMRPYVVERIIDGRDTTEAKPLVVRRAVSALAAAEITKMLVYAVETTLGADFVPGYSVAAKSGTSEVPVPGGYDPEETIASFAGYVPAENPRFSILVVIDRPQKEHWGGRVAAPVFGDIARQIVTLLGVPPGSAQAPTAALSN